MLWTWNHVEQKIVHQSLWMDGSRTSEKACIRTFQAVPLYLYDKLAYVLC